MSQLTPNNRLAPAILLRGQCKVVCGASHFAVRRSTTEAVIVTGLA